MSDTNHKDHPYTEFICNVRSMVNKGTGFNAKNDLPGPEKTLQELADYVFPKLQDPLAIDAVCGAFHTLAGKRDPHDWPTGKAKAVHDALRKEIDYFNQKHGNSDGKNAKAFDDAKTVKDSIEDVLGEWLPQWIKKLLKILNELLSLVRPI